MICTVIKGPSLSFAKRQMENAAHCSDLIELRLDLFENINCSELSELIKGYSLPMIFTFRTKEGIAEEQRLFLIEQLAQLKPAFFDLEENISSSFIQHLQSRHPEIQWIISHHDFEKTGNLPEILQKMLAISASFYKIATFAKSSLDALKMLLFMQGAPKNVLCVSMGEKGSFTRLFTKPFTYASLEDDLQTAPGQISAEKLVANYNIRSITSETQYYALLGSPISRSVSHVTHNEAMRHFQINARYLKIEVEKAELGAFLALAKRLPIKGFSITMPLKEEVAPFLDEINTEAAAIGAVNTVVVRQEKYLGFNTDGKGALEAIEAALPVKGKKIVILGAGGSSKAIAYEAKTRGAEVYILNRTEERARTLADQIKCFSGTLEDVAVIHYDVLINATSSSLPIDPKHIIAFSTVMDINTLPKYSSLLIHAQEKGCKLVFGYQMFAFQAAWQFSLWFPGIDKEKAAEVILRSASSCV